MKNVLDKFKEKLIISIAHRITTLRAADKIIVLDDGHIIEANDAAAKFYGWTREKLMKMNILL